MQDVIQSVMTELIPESKYQMPVFVFEYTGK
jgi:hypothetical protein